MSTLDVAMLIIAVVFAIVVGLQVYKLVKVIRDKKRKRNGENSDPASIENVSDKDKKGE